jgi:hypothetical protein
MNENLLRYKGWQKINELENEVGNCEKIKEILEDFVNNYFNNVSEALYINIGFVHHEIFRIYRGLENIYQFWPKESNITLQELLKRQFGLMKKHNVYLYSIIQKLTYFELRDKERVNEVFKRYYKLTEEINEIKNGLCELFTEYTSIYLTIYYGDVFMLDSLLIFKKGFKDESVILFVKAYLQYLAGYLMFQISTVHALRSAVAAIMSRNMSHNIGSHVLNYLSNPEELDSLWII